MVSTAVPSSVPTTKKTVSFEEESSMKNNLAQSLRQTVRLIHCLQKERGASSIYCSTTLASHSTTGGKDDDSFRGTLYSARRDTDSAILLALSLAPLNMEIVNIRNSVEEVRSLVEGCTTSNDTSSTEIKSKTESLATNKNKEQEKKEENIFHAIFLEFNHIVSRIINIQIVHKVRSSPYYGLNTIIEKRKTTIKKTNSHSHLFHDLKRWDSAGDHENYSSIPVRKRTSSSENIEIVGKNESIPSPVRRPSFPSAKSNEKQEEAFLSLLLSTLLLFVRLKESTGIERTILSSLVAQKEESSSKDYDTDSQQEQFYVMPFINDLVMEIENQHYIIHKLQKQTHEQDNYHSTASLLSLVEQGVSLSPFMKRLQDMIRKDFDLVSFRQATSLIEFWSDITLYIDKLHSLELLIIEEIESCSCFMAVKHQEDKHSPSRATKINTMKNDSNIDDEVMSPRNVYSADTRRDMALVVVAQADVQADNPPLFPETICLGEENLNHDKNIRESNNNDVLQLLHDIIHVNVKDTPRSCSSTKTSIASTTRNNSSNDLLLMINKMPPNEIKSSLIAFVSSSVTATSTDNETEENRSLNIKHQHERKTHSDDDCTQQIHTIRHMADIQDVITTPQSSSSANNIAIDASNRSDSMESNKEWEIGLYEVEFQKRIGRGMAGTTYLAKWSGQNVAVKVAAITEMGLVGWNAEVKALSKLHHPNIIRLLGSIYNENPLTYCLVLEYCDAGDLNKTLLRYTPRNFFDRVSADVANGMKYLHSRNILHRDIKPGNILLHGDVQGGNFTAKLTDFGVSTGMQGSTSEDHTAETGTYRWMAPEVIRHEAYSYKADVWSFAVLLWQLITREEPFCQHSQIEAAGMVALEQARPPFPKGTPKDVRQMIGQCWRENPDDRMAFDGICVALSKMEMTLNADEKLWLQEPYGHPVYNLKKESIHSRIVGRSKSWHSASDDVPSSRTLVPRRPQAPKNERKSFIKMFSRSKKI